MNASRFVPSGVIAAGVPDVVGIDRPGLIRAVKPCEASLPSMMSVWVTGISVESGISFLTARECSASQKPVGPVRAQWPDVPLTLGPEMNSGFDGIVVAPVYRPIFGLASCLRATGKLDSPVTGV